MGGSSTSSTSTTVTTQSDSNNATTSLVSDLSNVGNVPLYIGSTVGSDQTGLLLAAGMIGAVVLVFFIITFNRK
jgi:hypothetical protein